MSLSCEDAILGTKPLRAYTLHTPKCLLYSPHELPKVRSNNKPLSPLFVVSPTGMSGTNFLVQALVTVGLCELPRRDVLAREDHLLVHSNLLKQYVCETANTWNKWERNGAILQTRSKALMATISDGILRFIGAPMVSSKRVVLKTPTSHCVANFPDLFPRAKLILLVRDGRDSTESEVRAAYRRDYDSAFTIWAVRVRELLDFMEGPGKEWGSSWLLVHYEDLVTIPISTIAAIASFLEQEASVVDVGRIAELPVFGSSQLGTENGRAFHWAVQEKPENFNPIGRWTHWDRERRDLFKKIAGRELAALGYDQDDSW